jgi:squalene-associated FAD-dependent desaturase
LDCLAVRNHLMARSVHIVGAGLAGLAAAIRLTRSAATIVVHEATTQPGGRCRSYFDRAIGMIIDNGNHLVLSGNHAVLEFAREIGREAGLVGPAAAEFPFIDLKSKERWTLRINNGPPWWIFDRSRRPPGTSLGEYLQVGRLLWAPNEIAVQNVINCSGPLYERLLHPVFLAALNIDPREGSATLASAIFRGTLLAGGRACRPLIAREGLSSVLIEPAIHTLKQCNVSVRLEHELRALRFSGDRVSELAFGPETVSLDPDDAVILAVPAHAAVMLLADLSAPDATRAIANAHFRIDPPATFPPMIGVINGTVEWIFSFPGRLSVTISNADRLMDVPRAELAQTIWKDVSEVAGIAGEMPPWQIVRERRATFAATPEQNARRPAAATRWTNLFLAGDWTATGLPATLESAVRSGNRAADLATRFVGSDA